MWRLASASWGPPGYFRFTALLLLYTVHVPWRCYASNTSLTDVQGVLDATVVPVGRSERMASLCLFVVCCGPGARHT